jgi:hypothetical protein
MTVCPETPNSLPMAIADALRLRLMGLHLMHRFSHFDAQVRIPDWRGAGSLDALAERIWPELS